MPDEHNITWHVLTHEHKVHTADWYWALGLLTLLGAGLSIYFGNILLALILIIGAGSIMTLKIRGPREHQVRVDSRGIALDGTLYVWKTVDSFWVNTNTERGGPCIYLTTKSILAPRITVPLDNLAHAEQVRVYCKRFAREEEQWPHFGEHIAEILGL
ncbi:MAG: hypothetical protein NT019_01215 [Candidatus Adlerbacteria bacterium]|nr:hypothetical protein [Candidatus Adlerbacteria bacterium]